MLINRFVPIYICVSDSCFSQWFFMTFTLNIETYISMDGFNNIKCCNEINATIKACLISFWVSFIKLLSLIHI